MFGQFATRSSKLERLDTGDFTAGEYLKWQAEMSKVHSFMGEVRALRNSLLRDIEQEACETVSILDVGAGTGALLRSFGESMNGRPKFLAGAEINAEAARSILENGINAVRCDSRGLPFADGSFDYVTCSLFLHHLVDDEAVKLLTEMGRVARRRIFVVDLHRSPIAYYFYRLTSPLFLQRFTQEDGALSILRSFTPAEMRMLAEKAGLLDIKVQRSAAYRLVLSGRMPRPSA